MKTWLPISTAPRDGTIIELKNDYGIAPTYSLSRWIVPSWGGEAGWHDADDESKGTIDGDHLSWRPYTGDPTNYIDPTGGAQFSPEYWQRAAGIQPTIFERVGRFFRGLSK